MERKGSDRNPWVRAAAAACLVMGVSGLVKVYGLEEVVFFSKGLVSLGVFALGFWAAKRARIAWREDRRNFVICALISWGLMFTEMLGTAMRLEATRGGVNLRLSGFLAMLGASVAPALMAAPCLMRVAAYTIEPEAAYGEGRGCNRVFFAVWGLLFVCYLPCILAFYPGLYCYDMVWQWSQFASWDFTTHHPLLHTLLSGGLIELGKILGGSYHRGLALHSLVQTLFLTGSMAWAIRFLVKRRVRRCVTAFAAAFFLLFPFFPVMGISTTKDTVFAGCFLLTFVGICDMVWEGKCYTGGRLAVFLAFATLMCLFRNNAVYGLAVLVCCLILAFLAGAVRGRKSVPLVRAAVLTMACILLSLGLSAALERGLGAEKGSRAEMLSLPMQQMARSYVYHREEFSEEDKEELLRFFDESWLLRYKYYVSDPVKAGMKMEAFDAGDFARLWLKLGRQFPGEYVKSPLYNTMGLWYLGGDSSCYMEYRMSPPFDEEHRVELRSKLPLLREFYSWFTDGNLQKYLPGICILFYTSFYSWCVVLAAGILAAKRKYRCLILPLFLACYQFTLVFGPCILIRYCLGVILCIPVLAVMVFAPASQAGEDTAGGPQ